MARIGVPADERALPQRLEADVMLWPSRPLTDLGDDLSRTINYADVATALRTEAARQERQLIETLTEDLCRMVLARWPLEAIRVTLHKFILPDTRAVSITLTRRPADFAVPVSN
ncbi:MAG: Haloacid dehalogenase domain protein hydrolase [Verrucomicrobiales bacterium]|nr:Haloacid dehalogenase domain protein hydrolase [Verrucomicrobiales bacterium]